MKKRAIGILLALLLVLLLIGCAWRGMEQQGLEAEQLAQEEVTPQPNDAQEPEDTRQSEPEEPQELEALPKEKLYDLFDSAYRTYEIAGFETEESIGYEVYEVMRMLSSYEGHYILPSEEEVEAEYRLWRPKDTAPASGGDTAADGGDTTPSTPPSTSTPPDQTPPEQTDQSTSSAPTGQPPLPMETYVEYCETHIPTSRYDEMASPDHDWKYTYSPQLLAEFHASYPELSLDDIIAVFGPSIIDRDRPMTEKEKQFWKDYVEYHEEHGI